MQRSEQRILTSHVGSFPRSPRLLDLLVRRNAGGHVDEAALERQLETDMDEVVRKQA